MKVILLENIRSVFNVGGIFRIADATGVDEIVLIGYTPTPINRFGLKNNKLSKTALGAEEHVSWKSFKTTKEALNAYTNYTHVLIEQTQTSKAYTEMQKEENILFIFGNEVDGIDQDTRNIVKKHFELPMEKTKESLNVTTCAAVVLYYYNALI